MRVDRNTQDLEKQVTTISKSSHSGTIVSYFTYCLQSVHLSVDAEKDIPMKGWEGRVEQPIFSAR